ncbi:MAG: nitrate reductase associated protein, partial [Ginsengibacter sp.]
FEERKQLCEFGCSTVEEVQQFKNYLEQIVSCRTGNEVTNMQVETNPAWANRNEIPQLLKENLAEFNWSISVTQWQALSHLQRFVLMKLCRPGHENRNLPKAVKEFGLV